MCVCVWWFFLQRNAPFFQTLVRRFQNPNLKSFSLLPERSGSTFVYLIFSVRPGSRALLIHVGSGSGVTTPVAIPTQPHPSAGVVTAEKRCDCRTACISDFSETCLGSVFAAKTLLTRGFGCEAVARVALHVLTACLSGESAPG